MISQSNPSVLIATPMYGGMCTLQYTSSLINALSDLKKHNIHSNYIFLENESLIPRGRNSLTHEFLKSEFTHIMFIDADIEFESWSIRKLLSHDKDVVCGLYPKKYLNWERIKEEAKFSSRFDDLESIAADLVWNPVPNGSYKTKDLAEVLHGGTGFMCINRNVFEKLKSSAKKYYVDFEELANQGYTYEFWKTKIDQGFYQSEDWNFCEEWRKHGGKIYADLSIELRHKGSYLFKGKLVE